MFCIGFEKEWLGTIDKSKGKWQVSMTMKTNLSHHICTWEVVSRKNSQSFGSRCSGEEKCAKEQTLEA
jgi:hypothetical protein